MKQDLIILLFEQFERACLKIDGVDCWSARELQEIFDYSKWDNFLKVVAKAREACENAGANPDDHFLLVTKEVVLGNGAGRTIDDIALTRYACYLIAQNGDPSKDPVAFAQTYFAVQTRKQELVQQRMHELERVAARDKLSRSEKKLSKLLFERNVNELGFANIRSKGDKALFGGHATSEMKIRLGIPKDRTLADFLPTLVIKAKDFAMELTSHNIVDKDLRGETEIVKEHTENNVAVRKMLRGRGVVPENLPVAEDVRKLQRKLENEEKSIAKSSKAPS